MGLPPGISLNGIGFRSAAVCCSEVRNKISGDPRDKVGVSRLTQQAQDLLDAALSATERGEKCTPMTILIGHDGGIRMCADSDWPLESLAREHGAWTAFRVAQENGRVRVQGREGPHACLLESQSQQGVARLLLR